MVHLIAHEGPVALVQPVRAVFTHGTEHDRGHEVATHDAAARRLAGLLDLPYAGPCDAAPPLAKFYLVPRAPLSGAQATAMFAIRDESDFFGGWVPRDWMATKAIMHPLVSEHAAAPEGWMPAFARDSMPLTLRGFAAFSATDALAAARELLRSGPVRIKCANADGGQGQFVARNDAEVLQILGLLCIGDVLTDIVTLEENLEEVVTFSVGQVRLPGRVISYFGTQSQTRNNEGDAAYGGSSLFVTRGGFDRLLSRDLPKVTREAVRRAVTFDAMAERYIPGFLASRRNYDIACGTASDGSRRIGVLEQSWRIGGATGAEIAALELFAREPLVGAVRAKTVEVYGKAPVLPEDAVIYFQGCDPVVGPLTKYACVEEKFEG